MMLIEYLKEQLRGSATFNKSVQVAPAAILWTDIDYQWQSAMPFIKQHLPELVELGEYKPESRIGPAIWIKCAISGVLDECLLPADKTPIIYLPGVGRKDLRAIEQCPEFLKPLAELQYRGCWWAYNSAGRDWTVASFLTNPKVGLELDLAKDKKTQDVILKVLPDLLEATEATLKGKKLEADDFFALVLDDQPKDILGWLNDSDEKMKQWQGSRWDIFTQSCQSKYGFSPEQSDQEMILHLLCEAQGEWQVVWQRFEDTASNLPLLISKLKFIKQGDLLVANPENYLSENDNDEGEIETVFKNAPSKTRTELQKQFITLWGNQQSRKEWLWYRLTLSPWLTILEEIINVLEHTEIHFSGSSPEMMAEYYRDRFWKADAAVLRAMANAQYIHKQELVANVLGVIYTPWLEKTTLNFQQLVHQSGYPGDDQVTESTANYSVKSQVIFFVDGLRFDTAKLLEEKLVKFGLKVDLKSCWSALPSLTATAKAAVTPLADMLTGLESNDDFIPAFDSKTAFSSYQLKKCLNDKGWQYLDGSETGDAKGFAWVQTGDLDHLGHQQQRNMPQYINQVLDDVVSRIRGLLDAGWVRIKIVTDHGWLWVPDGLPKSELPKALGKNRQRRCAILKDNVHHDGLVMPWHWNKTVSIAMAPGISAFVAGDYYNHGGLSLQECLTPELNIKSNQ